MNKNEIITKLTELKIEHDPQDSKADLLKLLEEASSGDDEKDPSTRPSGIVVRDPNVFRPKILPLVVILPEGASKAQIARAKVLNGYAYQFPDKWEKRKEELLLQLEELKNAPDPVEDPNVRLTIGTNPFNK